MACPGQKKEQRFIPVVGEGFLLRCQQLPIVVYAPKDVEVRYRIWSASEKVEKAVSEYARMKAAHGRLFVAPASARHQADVQAGVHGDPVMRGLPVLHMHHLLGRLAAADPIALHGYHPQPRRKTETRARRPGSQRPGGYR